MAQAESPSSNWSSGEGKPLDEGEYGMSRIKGHVVKVMRKVDRQVRATFAIGGHCPHCGMIHSLEAEHENYARVGLQESYEFCAPSIQSQQVAS